MLKKVILSLVFTLLTGSLQANSMDDDFESFYTNVDFATGVYAEIQAAVTMAQAENNITNSDMKEIFPDKCDILIDQIAYTVRKRVTPLLLEGADDMRRACPQWDSLSEDDRKDFYVALVTSMALAESSCDNTNHNRSASNGTAYGLWQSTKKLSPVKGAAWVMGQIDDQVEKSGKLFWANSNLNYWAVLNPNIHAHKVKKILRKIPACVANGIKQSQ